MGLALTICYLLLAYLSPAVLVPSLASYHIQVGIAALALLASLPAFFRSGITRQPSLYCLAIFFCMVGISSIANSGVRAGLSVVEEFSSSCIIFILIVANCSTLRRVKIIWAVIVTLTIYFVLRGTVAYWHDTPFANSLFVLHQGPSESYIPRIRGLGFVNDPNDFSQMIVCCMPLLWLWWKPNHKLSNLIAIYLPLSVLLMGAYLTHSRGGLIALGVVLVLVLRRRLGSAFSVITTAILAAAMMFLNFTGGRDISAETGTDRMEAWSAGLQFARDSPLWGIGYGRFPDHYPITAHNSFVLCIAEIGFLGYFSWMALIVAVALGAWIILRGEGEAVYSEDISTREGGSTPLVQRMTWSSSQGANQGESAEEVRRSLRLSLISLAGFLSAAWFLSRAYTLPLYMILGTVSALTLLALRQDDSQKTPAVSVILRYTVGAGLLIISVIYVILRLHWVYQ
jgi:O-antigen ligase